MVRPNNDFFNQRFNLPISGNTTVEDYVTQQIPAAHPLSPRIPVNIPPANPTTGNTPVTPQSSNNNDDIFIPKAPEPKQTTIKAPWQGPQGEIDFEDLRNFGKVMSNYPKGALKAVNDINSLPQTTMAGVMTAGSGEAKLLAQEARNNAMLAEAKGDTNTAKMYNDLAEKYEQASVSGLEEAQEWANKAAEKPGILEKAAPESLSRQAMDWAYKVDAQNETLGEAGKYFAGLAESAGRMTVTHAVGKAAAGLGVLTGAYGLVQHAEDIGLAAMGIGVYNNELKQATLQGYDVQTATTKAVISAGTEVATEYLVSGIPGFKVKDPVTGEMLEHEGVIDKVISKFAEKALANAEAQGVTSGGIKALGEIGAGYLRFVNSPAGKVITDIVGEGMEEVVADIANPVLNRWFNPGASEEDKTVQWGNGNMVMSWLGGAISSAFFESASNIKQFISDSHTKGASLESVTITPTVEDLEQAAKDYAARRSDLRKYRRLATPDTSFQRVDMSERFQKTPEEVEAVAHKHAENLEQIKKAEAEDIPNATEEQKSVFEAVKLVNYAMLGGLNTMTEEGKEQYTGTLSQLKTKLAVDFLPDTLLTWTPNMTMEDVDTYIRDVVLPAYAEQNRVVFGDIIAPKLFSPDMIADIPFAQVFDGTIKLKPTDVIAAKADVLKEGHRNLTVAQLNATGINDKKLSPEQRTALIKEYIDPLKLFQRLYAESPSGAEKIYGKIAARAYENQLNSEAFDDLGVLRVGEGNNYMTFREFVKSTFGGKRFEQMSDKEKAQAVALFKEAQALAVPKEYISQIEQQLNRFGVEVEWLTKDELKNSTIQYGEISKDGGTLKLNPYRINSRGGAAFVIAHEMLGHFAQNNDPNLNMTEASKEICKAIGIDYDKESAAVQRKYPTLSGAGLEQEVNAHIMGKMLASDNLLDYFASIHIDDARALQTFLDTLIDPEATDAFTRQIRGIYANIAQSIDGTFEQRKEETEMLGPEEDVEEVEAEEEAEVEETEEVEEVEAEEVEAEETGAEEVAVEEETEEPIQIPKAKKTYVATDPVTINLQTSNPLSALNGWRMTVNETWHSLKLSKSHQGPATAEEEAALNMLGFTPTRRGSYEGTKKYWDTFRHQSRVVPDLAADGTKKSNHYSPNQYVLKGDTNISLAWRSLGGPDFQSDSYVKLLHTHLFHNPVAGGQENRRQRRSREILERSADSMINENMVYNITEDLVERKVPVDSKNPKKGTKKQYPSLKPLEGSIIRVNATQDRNGVTVRNISIEPPGDAFKGKALKMIKGLGFHTERQQGVNRVDDLSGSYVGRTKTIYYMSEDAAPTLTGSDNKPAKFLEALRARDFEAIFKGAEKMYKERNVELPKPAPGTLFTFVNAMQDVASTETDEDPQSKKKKLAVMFWPSKAALRGELGRYNPDGHNADDEAWGHMIGVIVTETNEDGVPTKIGVPYAQPFRAAFYQQGFTGYSSELGGNILSKPMDFSQFRQLTGANVDVNKLIADFKRANPKLVLKAASEPERVFVRIPFKTDSYALATRDPRTGIVVYDSGEELEFNTLYSSGGRWHPYMKGGKAENYGDGSRVVRNRDIPGTQNYIVTYDDGTTETVKNGSPSEDEFRSESLGDERGTFDMLSSRGDVVKIESKELNDFAHSIGAKTTPVLYDAYDPERSLFYAHATEDWAYKGNKTILVTRTNDPVPQEVKIDFEGAKAKAVEEKAKQNAAKAKTEESAPKKKNLRGKPKKDVDFDARTYYGSLLLQLKNLVTDPSVVSITGKENGAVIYMNTSPETRERTLLGIKASLDPDALRWRAHGKDIRIKFFGDPVWYPYGTSVIFDYGITNSNGDVTHYDTSVEKIVLKGKKADIPDNSLPIIKDGKVVGKKTYEQWLDEKLGGKRLQYTVDTKDGAQQIRRDAPLAPDAAKYRKEFRKLVQEAASSLGDTVIYDSKNHFNQVIAKTYPELNDLYVEFDDPEYKQEDGTIRRVAWTTGVFDDYVNTKGIMAESVFRNTLVDRLNVAIAAMNKMRADRESGKAESDVYSPDTKKYAPQTEAKWASDVEDYQAAITSMGGGLASLDRRIISLTRSDGSYVYKRSMADPENAKQSFGSVWFDLDTAKVLTELAGGRPEISEYVPLQHIPYDPDLTKEQAAERAYKYQIGYVSESIDEKGTDVDDVVAGTEADDGFHATAEGRAEVAATPFGKLLPGMNETTPAIDNARDDVEAVAPSDKSSADISSNTFDISERVLKVSSSDIAADIEADKAKAKLAAKEKRENRKAENQRERAAILGSTWHVTQQVAVKCPQAPELDELKAVYSYRDDEIWLDVPALGDKFTPSTVEAQNFLGFYQFYMKDIKLDDKTTRIILAAKYRPELANALGMGFLDVKNDNSQSIYSLADDKELYDLAMKGSVRLYDKSGSKKGNLIKVEDYKLRKDALDKIEKVRAKGRLVIEDLGGGVGSYNLYDDSKAGMEAFRNAFSNLGYNDRKKYSDYAISQIMAEMAEMQRRNEPTFSEDTLEYKKALDAAITDAQKELGRGLSKTEMTELIHNVAAPFEKVRLEKAEAKSSKYLKSLAEDSLIQFFTQEGLDLEDQDVVNEGMKKIAEYDKDKYSKLKSAKTFAERSDLMKEYSKPFIRKATRRKKIAAEASAKTEEYKSLYDLVNFQDTSDAAVAAFKRERPGIARGKTDEQIREELILRSTKTGVNLKDKSAAGIAAFREAFPLLTQGLTDNQVKSEMSKRASEANKLKRERATAEVFAQRKREVDAIKSDINTAVVESSPEYKAASNLRALEQRFTEAFRQVRGSEIIKSGLENQKEESSEFNPDKAEALVRSAHREYALRLPKEEQDKIDALLKGRSTAFYKDMKGAGSLDDSDKERYKFLRFHDMPETVDGFVKLADEWLEQIGYYELPSAMSKMVTSSRTKLRERYESLEKAAERRNPDRKTPKELQERLSAMLGTGFPFYASGIASPSDSASDYYNNYYRYSSYKDDPRSLFEFFRGKELPNNLEDFARLAKEYMVHIGYEVPEDGREEPEQLRERLMRQYIDGVSAEERSERGPELDRLYSMIRNASEDFLLDNENRLLEPDTYEKYAEDFYSTRREYDAQGRPLSRQQASFFKDKYGGRDRYKRLIPLTPSSIAQPIPQNVSFGDLTVYTPANEGSGEIGYAAMTSPLVVGGPNASMVPAGIQKGRNAVLDLILKRQPKMEKNLYGTLVNTGNNIGVKNFAGQLFGGNYQAADVIDNVARAFGGATATEQAQFKKEILMELGYDGVQIWNPGTRNYDTVLLLNPDQFVNIDDTDPSAPQAFLDELDRQELLDSISEFSGTEADENPETVGTPKSGETVFNQTTQKTIAGHAPTPQVAKLLNDLVAQGEVGIHDSLKDTDAIQEAERWIGVHGGGSIDKAFQNFSELWERDELVSAKDKNAATAVALSWILAVRMAEAAEEDVEHKKEYQTASIYACDVFDQLVGSYGQALRMASVIRNLAPKIALSSKQGVLGNMERWLKGINKEYHTDIKMTDEQRKALTDWKDDNEKLAAIDAFGEYVAQQLPKGFKNSKYFDELRKAMMLSAPRTGIVNFVSNVAMRALDSVKNVVAGAISDVVLPEDAKANRSLKNSTRITADPRIAEDWDAMNEWAPTMYEANHDAIINTGGKWWDTSGSTSRVQKSFESEKDIFRWKLPEWIGKYIFADAEKSVVKNTSKHQSDWFENTDDTGLVDFIASGLPDVFLGKDVTGLKEKIRSSNIPNFAGLKATWVPAFKSYLRSRGYTTTDLEKANHLREARMALKAEHDPAKVDAAKARVKECEDAAKAISDAVEFATKEAQSVTYRSKNAFAQLVNSFKKKTVDSDDPGQKALLWVFQKALDSEIPFTTVLFNMVNTAIKYDPFVAAPMAVYQYANSKGKNAKYDANDVIDTIAKGLVGFSVEALGAMLAAAGKLRGTGDSDEKRVEDFYTNVGGQADYAWVTDEGDSYTLDWMGPLAMRLFRGVALYEFFAKLAASRDADTDATPMDGVFAAFGVLGSGMGPMAEMSFMTSINSLVKAIAREDAPGDMLVAAIKHPAQNYLMQAIPAISGRVANAIDPTVRSTYAPAGPGKQLMQTGRQIANKIPFLKQAVNSPKYDYFGNEISNAVFDQDTLLGKLGNAAYTLYSPGYVNKNKVSEGVGNVLDEVFAGSNDKGIYPTEAPKNFTVEGTKYVMSHKEYAEMSERAGSYTERAYEMTVDNYAFNNMLNAEQQADVLKNLQTIGKTMAKSDYCYLNGIEGYSGDETLKKIIDAQDVGLDLVTYYSAKQLIKNISGKGAAAKKRKILRSYGFDTRQIEALI